LPDGRFFRQKSSRKTDPDKLVLTELPFFVDFWQGLRFIPAAGFPCRKRLTAIAAGSALFVKPGALGSACAPELAISDEQDSDGHQNEEDRY
jgi:hypothetical protein